MPLLFKKLKSFSEGTRYLKEIASLSLPEQEKLDSLKAGLDLIEGNLKAGLPQEEKIKALDSELNSLKEQGLIAMAYILNKQGEIISSTEEWLKSRTADSDDLKVLEKINSGQSVKEETIINKSLKLFSRYIPLKDADTVNFVVRVFFPLGDLWSALEGVYAPAIAIGVALILVNIILGVFLSHLVIKPIGIFNEAAKKIAGGQLNLKVDISTNDELEELADTFNFMAEELIRMKEKAENANPLTKLPGNIVIMEEVEKKIKTAKQFVVIYCDLDNFKAFNVKYGIHKGDEAIILTGEIFKEAVKAQGNPDDFIGHEGGDDFILLTTPDKAQGVANYIMEELDKRSKALYDKEDIERGYIIAHARDGTVKKFPLLSISLAGVTNQYRKIDSYAEVTNIAATLKKKAKQEAHSCFVMDERKEA